MQFVKLIMLKWLEEKLEGVESGQVEQIVSPADIKYVWFKKGKNSVLRKNKSGCCCIIDDSDNIISACGAHEEWLKKHLWK